MTSRTERLLDETGWRILDALQADARLSFSALGRRVGLSGPAVAERVRRMEDAGIITGYRADVAVGHVFPVTALIRVSAPEEEENCTRLAARSRGLPEVLEAYRVTGTDRLVLKVVASSVEHLDRVIRQLSEFGTATVSIVLSSRRQAVRRLRGRGETEGHRTSSLSQAGPRPARAHSRKIRAVGSSMGKKHSTRISCSVTSCGVPRVAMVVNRRSDVSLLFK